MLKIMFQPRLASQEVLIVIQGGSLPFINGVYTPYKSGISRVISPVTPIFLRPFTGRPITPLMTILAAHRSYEADDLLGELIPKLT